MPVILRSALVEHAAARMFALVNDVAAYPRRFDWCREAQVLEQGDDRLVARLDLGLGGFHTWFTTLGWRPDHPQALLALAERQLAQGKFAESRANARRLLAHEPLQGVAFRLLAAAADREGRRDDASRLYLIAEKRAPRDLQARAWLTQRYLERGDFAQALEQVDRILRMAPQRARSINPVLAQLVRRRGHRPLLLPARRRAGGEAAPGTTMAGGLAEFAA